MIPQVIFVVSFHIRIGISSFTKEGRLWTLSSPLRCNPGFVFQVDTTMSRSHFNRRQAIHSMLTGPAALLSLEAFNAKRTEAAAIGPKDQITVTAIDTFVLKNSWVFVRISTDAGITGWGEMLKDDAKACAAGALEVGKYLIGKDPRPVVHH